MTPRTWIGWVAAAIAGLGLLVTAALFLTVALIAGLLIAGFLVARALWLIRKAEKARAEKFLQTEYRVERDETRPIEGRASQQSDRQSFK